MKLYLKALPLCLLAMGILEGCSGLSSAKKSEQPVSSPQTQKTVNSEQKLETDQESLSGNQDPSPQGDLERSNPVDSVNTSEKTVVMQEPAAKKEEIMPQAKVQMRANDKPGPASGDHVTKKYNSSASQKILNVDKLLNTSSMAKQIINSANQEALLLHEQALSQLDTAKSAKKNGDEASMDASLSSAKKLMFQAIRATGTSKSVTDKRFNDCEKKFRSAMSMLEAHKRVSREKGVTKETSQTESHVEKMLKKADEYCKNNRVSEARKIVDDAFITTKLSLTQLRSGDTLVRSLDFATKEDEYKYEIDRNNSHKMLVTVLLKEKMSSPSIAKNVETNMKKAEKLREQAEGEASKGDFEAAIKTLELSTKQIFRAIRSAGIFIPG